MDRTILEIVALGRALQLNTGEPHLSRATLERFREVTGIPYHEAGNLRYQPDLACFSYGADGEILNVTSVPQRELTEWLAEQAVTRSDDLTHEGWLRSWPWAVEDGQPALYCHFLRGAKRPKGIDPTALATLAFARIDAVSATPDPDAPAPRP